MPADLYTLYYSLFSRNKQGCVFVPIRSMQVMAVLDKREIIFVDSQSYAYSGNEGGRLIVIAWKFSPSHNREALTESRPCEIVFYGKNLGDLQLRLIAEFRQAMELLDRRYRYEKLPASGAKIIVLHSQTPPLTG